MFLNKSSDTVRTGKYQMELWDDFIFYTDATTAWTKTVGSGATASCVAPHSLQLATGSTQNTFASVASTIAMFKFLKYQPWYFECRLQYTEASTNQAAIAVGLASVTSTSLITSTTGVPDTSMSAALIYKQTGDTYWRCITSNGSTQALNQSVQSSQQTPTTNYVTLRIEGRDVDGSNTEVTFFLNDEPLIDNSTHRPIKQIVAEASAAAMYAVLALKNVGGANSETLLVDYVYANQRRFGYEGPTATGY